MDGCRFFKKLPKVFCVTDPDLQLNAKMPLNFTDRLLAVSEKYKMGKVGLALDIAERAGVARGRLSHRR